MGKPKVIAYYLPQFHPIKENDQWWGEGFTEWTNVGRAEKLFRGHLQPRVPAHLGYYDLRLPEVRARQAELAKFAGIDGFAYWHYWFAGKRLLERPFEEVVATKEPAFPFCLAWANETWTGAWNNDHKRILIEQTYPGTADFERHFFESLSAFKDERYLKHQGRLLFVIYKPLKLPDSKGFISLWNRLAKENGLEGFFFVGVSNDPLSETHRILERGFDAVNAFRMIEAQNRLSRSRRLATGISRKYFGGRLGLSVFQYEEITKNWTAVDDELEQVIPSILPNWDNTPRSGRRGTILVNSSPEGFETHLSQLLDIVAKKNNSLVFLKSWNEWAEGNFVEPDLRFGMQYLEVLRKKLLG